MENVFTLQWPEFVVAQSLQTLLTPKKGYSILIPISRQEKGFDLAVFNHNKNKKSKILTIQVKSSRTYLRSPKYKYHTWFNTFDVSDRTDYVILVGLYAPDLVKTSHLSAKWYKDCSLLFSRNEMREFLANCQTVGGKPDRMFGFGFNNLDKIVLTRGDKNRSGKDYSKYLLEHRYKKLLF